MKRAFLEWGISLFSNHATTVISPRRFLPPPKIDWNGLVGLNRQNMKKQEVK